MYGLVNPGGLGRFHPSRLWIRPAIATMEHRIEVSGTLLDVDPPVAALLHRADLALSGQATHMLDDGSRLARLHPLQSHGEKRRPEPFLAELTVPEVRRLLEVALPLPYRSRELRLAWSLYRRAKRWQATIAASCGLLHCGICLPTMLALAFFAPWKNRVLS